MSQVKNQMPIYMDVHIVPGVKAKDVAEAHRKDLLHQGEFGCNCMTYWIDEKRDSIFCLIEATDKEAVKEMHNKAHGLVPNKIVEVSSSIVESFLGRIYDPEDATVTDDGLKIFCDPSYRILMVAQVTDPALLQHKLGEDKATEMLKRLNSTIRKNISIHEGSEAEHGGDGIVASFTSASKAIACALAIKNDLPEREAELAGLKLAINGGEPLEKSNRLFGDTIYFANLLCQVAPHSQIAVAYTVKELSGRELVQNNRSLLLMLTPAEENFLQALFSNLEKNWQDPEFDTPDYCRAMAMSQSQLYRKTTSITGISFNILLKDYRLEQARKLMNKRQDAIAQITFESGFSSPSYFTKCFKKKYGILPLAYYDLLH